MNKGIKPKQLYSFSDVFYYPPRDISGIWETVRLNRMNKWELVRRHSTNPGEPVGKKILVKNGLIRMLGRGIGKEEMEKIMLNAKNEKEV